MRVEEEEVGWKGGVVGGYVGEVGVCFAAFVAEGVVDGGGVVDDVDC